jgi:hypothetical protein
MAHEAHHESNHAQADNKPNTSSSASFWFVIILIGLFISAVNFVSVMSHDTGGHGEGHSTEHSAPATHETSHEGAHHAEEAHTETNGEAH